MLVYDICINVYICINVDMKIFVVFDSEKVIDILNIIVVCCLYLIKENVEF